MKFGGIWLMRRDSRRGRPRCRPSRRRPAPPPRRRSPSPAELHSEHADLARTSRGSPHPPCGLRPLLPHDDRPDIALAAASISGFTGYPMRNSTSRLSASATAAATRIRLPPLRPETRTTPAFWPSRQPAEETGQVARFLRAESPDRTEGVAMRRRAIHRPPECVRAQPTQRTSAPMRRPPRFPPPGGGRGGLDGAPQPAAAWHPGCARGRRLARPRRCDRSIGMRQSPNWSPL